MRSRLATFIISIVTILISILSQAVSSVQNSLVKWTGVFNEGFFMRTQRTLDILDLILGALLPLGANSLVLGIRKRRFHP